MSGTLSTVLLECTGCGCEEETSRAVQMVPPEVSVITVNECDECNAAAGDYGSEEWWDENGKQVPQRDEKGNWRTGAKQQARPICETADQK